jgi:hypothetical protein
MLANAPQPLPVITMQNNIRTSLRIWTPIKFNLQKRTDFIAIKVRRMSRIAIRMNSMWFTPELAVGHESFLLRGPASCKGLIVSCQALRARLSMQTPLPLSVELSDTSG